MPHPRFGHPFRWQTQHYDQLRVSSNDELQPVEQLFDTPLKWRGSRKTIDEICTELSEFEINTLAIESKYRRFVFFLKEYGHDSKYMRTESELGRLCICWLNALNHSREFLGYRCTDDEDARIWLRLGKREQLIMKNYGVFAYPNEDEYPDRYPIAAILQNQYDLYNHHAELYFSYSKMEKFQAMRAAASKPAETAAILLGMAQEQAIWIHGCPRVSMFEPFLVHVKEWRVQIIKAQISLAYLKDLDTINTLEDISRNEEFVIRKSEWIDCSDPNNLIRLLSVLDAIVHSYDRTEKLSVELEPVTDDEGEEGSRSDSEKSSNSHESTGSSKTASTEIEPESQKA